MTSSADNTIVHDSLILRGEAAATATVVDLLGTSDQPVRPTGLWATQVNEAFEEARREGFGVGHQEGLAAGQNAGHDEAQRTAAAAIRALDELINDVQLRTEALCDDLGTRTADLALAATEAILARELAATTDPGREAIARCLAVGPATGTIEARLHPEDIKLLGHLEDLAGDRVVTIVPDSSLTRGDTMVRIGDTLVDGRLASALERLREVLQ